MSQSAFVRGFIDDRSDPAPRIRSPACLNPRSCAASSMTKAESLRHEALRTSQSAFVRGFIDDDRGRASRRGRGPSQSAFVRGFIDDLRDSPAGDGRAPCLNPRSCAASSMTQSII